MASHTKERVHAAVQSIGSAATGEVVDATQEKEVWHLTDSVKRGSGVSTMHVSELCVHACDSVHMHV